MPSPSGLATPFCSPDSLHAACCSRGIDSSASKGSVQFNHGSMEAPRASVSDRSTMAIPGRQCRARNSHPNRPAGRVFLHLLPRTRGITVSFVQQARPVSLFSEGIRRGVLVSCPVLSVLQQAEHVHRRPTSLPDRMFLLAFISLELLPFALDRGGCALPRRDDVHSIRHRHGRDGLDLAYGFASPFEPERHRVRTRSPSLSNGCLKGRARGIDPFPFSKPPGWGGVSCGTKGVWEPDTGWSGCETHPGGGRDTRDSRRDETVGER